MKGGRDDSAPFFLCLFLGTGENNTRLDADSQIGQTSPASACFLSALGKPMTGAKF